MVRITLLTLVLVEAVSTRGVLPSALKANPQNFESVFHRQSSSPSYKQSQSAYTLNMPTAAVIQTEIDALEAEMTATPPPDGVRLLEIASDLKDLSVELFKKQHQSPTIATPTTSSATTTIVSPFNGRMAQGTPESQLIEGAVTSKRSDRSKMDIKTKQAFVLEFQRGIDGAGYQRLALDQLFFSSSDKDSLILEAVNVLVINGELKEKLKRTESIDIFEVCKFGPGGVTDVKSKHDLFTNWLDLCDKTVIDSVNAHSMYPLDNHTCEDIMWSKHTVLNSIKDADLRAQITNKVSMFPEHNQTGPFTLFKLLNEIAFCDDRTTDRIAKQLEKLSIRTFQNEDIGAHGNIWSKITAFLKPYGKIPNGWKNSLLDQYAGCTIEDFVMHFKILRATSSPLLNTMESIIAEGIRMERELKSDGKWNPTTKQSPAFSGSVAKGEKPETAPSTLPSSGANQATTPGKAFLRTHDALGRPIDRTPPKPHEATTRTNGATGREETWCSHQDCGRWGSHDATGHDAWKARYSAQRKARFEAKKKSGEGNVTPATPTGAATQGATNNAQPTPDPNGPLRIAARSNMASTGFTNF
jgi:hypothetical protein